ncbi:MAG: MFS transporter [Thermomicrobiales bacterium]
MPTEKSALDEWKAAWHLPLVAAMGIATVNMPAYSLGVFFAPLERDMGWTRAQTSSGILAFSIVAVFGVPLIGRFVDLKGPRSIALPGVIAFAICFATLGLAKSAIWSWWALWSLLALAASLISPVVWTAAVASRFEKSRGVALATTLSGAGIGTAIAPLLSRWLIEAYGWQMAYAGIGAIICVVLLPLAFFFFFGANDGDRRFFDGSSLEIEETVIGLTFDQGIRNGKFLRLMLAVLLVAFGLLALVVHFVPILESLGISSARAAEAAALIGAGSIIGRLLGGVLLDHIRGTIVGFGVFSLPTLVAWALLYWGGNGEMIFVIAFMLGLSLGSEVDVAAYLTSRYVGLQSFGALFGIIVSALVLATGAGPWVAGLIFDRFGSYEYLLWGVMPLSLLAGLLVASLGNEPQYRSTPRGRVRKA